MSKIKANTTMAEAAPGSALARIMMSDLGEPSPRSAYYEPLGSDESAALQSKLADLERTHADAAACLPSLYAD